MRVIHVLAGFAVLALVPAARGTGLAPPPPKPAAVAMVADATVLGKVTEIEKDAVAAKPHQGFPMDPKVRYTIGVLKIDEPLIGAKGLTRVRVGFSDEATGTARKGVVPLGGGWPATTKLVVGQEGCFFLDRHPSADFYVLSRGHEVGVLKSARDYDEVMAEVRVVAKAIADPAAALRAKSQVDRFTAAATLLARAPRMTPEGTKDAELEDLPAEANRLLLDVLLEMPWNRRTYEAGRRVGPNVTREQFFLSSVDARRYGYEQPRQPPTPRGVSPPDMSKENDKASAAFLKENRDRIKLQRMVRPK